MSRSGREFRDKSSSKYSRFIRLNREKNKNFDFIDNQEFEDKKNEKSKRKPEKYFKAA